MYERRNPHGRWLASGLALAAACGDGAEKSAEDSGAGSAADAGPSDSETALGAAIPAPSTDDCITDVSPGDHTFTCQGLTFLVMVDEACTKRACGLIFDVHGGTMSGLQMRDNTKLHELAPPKGYLVVHPSATPMNTGGSWNLADDPPKVSDFMTRMIKAFHVNEKRIHVTGFSQGSGMTFWFLCNRPEVLASTAPISGASVDQITLVSSGGKCIDAIDSNWKPRVPILFMSGTLDKALTIEASRARIEGLVSRLGLSGGEKTAGDEHWFRKHYTAADGMVLDYIEHDYGGQPQLDGHCVPGGTDVPGAANNFYANGTTCITGDIKIQWGEVALKWFLDHPKTGA